MELEGLEFLFLLYYQAKRWQHKSRKQRQLNRGIPEQLVRSPLVLISQIARSGGTFLNQLFDHHPQVWTHPPELKIGHPKKWNWPDLTDIRQPDKAFAILRERSFTRPATVGAYYNSRKTPLPMVLDKDRQWRVFKDLASRYPADGTRGWLDIYFTAFFESWLDHQRRYISPKFIVAFASYLALSADGMRHFHAAYPDGWLVSVIREPSAWYASIKAASTNKRWKRYDNYPEGIRPNAGFADAEASYLTNIQAIYRNAALFGERFILIDYNELVSNREQVMRYLAERLSLDWSPDLGRQTFNGIPATPNTSFGRFGKSQRKSIVTREEIASILDGRMMAEYQRLIRDFDIQLSNSVLRAWS